MISWFSSVYLHFLDQSIGSKMITNYISGADAILMCYDITNYESFANLEDWYRLVLRTFASTKVPYVALLGNKSEPFVMSYYLWWITFCTDDLKHMTAVRFVQHSKFAEENGMSSFLMSAKNGDQVTQAFWKIASSLAGKSNHSSTDLRYFIQCCFLMFRCPFPQI